MAAALLGMRVYQFNSMDPVPLSSVPLVDFPLAGCLVRATNAPGTTGFKLATGQIVYSSVQVIATGNTYLVAETQATIAAAS